MTDKPIVVGYDWSPGAEAAQRWALDEAGRTGAPVRIVHVFEWPLHVAAVSPGPPGYPDAELRRETEARLAEAASTAQAARPALDVSATVVDGPTILALLEQSRRARVMVLGNRGRGGFAGLMLGSVGVAVSAHAHSPVVVVRGHERPADSGAPVVVGVDGSPDSLIAAGYAFEAAASRGVGVEAVRAWTPPAAPWHTDVRPLAVDADELAASERHALTDSLAGWREKYPDVPVRTHIVAGGAARAMIGMSRSAQLVVVGSRGLGGFRGLLLGSVSQQLLHHADCPVAVVREG
jgi:nucleotide-binding universal stress UspA family protein